MNKLECLCPSIFSSYELGSPTFSRMALYRRECHSLLFLLVIVTVLIQLHLFCRVSFCWMSWHQETTSLTLHYKLLLENIVWNKHSSLFLPEPKKYWWINNIRNGWLEYIKFITEDFLCKHLYKNDFTSIIDIYFYETFSTPNSNQ